MLLTQPFLVKKSLVPLLAATQIMFSQVQKGWYKNRNSFREISSADWVCPCCIRHSFMSKLYKEDKVITHNVLLFPTFFFQKTSDKFTNLSSIISKEREVVLGCGGWWGRCIQDAGVRLMMQTPAGVRCLLLGSHSPPSHSSFWIRTGLNWTKRISKYQDTFQSFHSWSTYLGSEWWKYEFLIIHFSANFSLEGHSLWSIIS